MKATLFYAMAGIVLMSASAGAFAENKWSNYQGVDTTKRPPAMNRPGYPQYGQNYPQHAPNYPQNHQNYPHRPPVYPQYPNRPYPQYPQAGISIQYNAPTTITQNSQSYTWVNGDPASASISSSTYTFISDWQRLGLPAPPSGTYWIFENGRYVLVPNR